MTALPVPVAGARWEGPPLTRDSALGFHRAGWVECWAVPSVTLTIDYTWHPIYPQKADEQLKQSRKSCCIICTLEV